MPFIVNAAAAGTATEMVFAAMNNDFLSNSINLTNYQSLVPSNSTNSYYQKFNFFNPKTGATDSTDVEFFTNSVVNLNGLILSGLHGYGTVYHVFSAATGTNDPARVFTAQAELDVELDKLPLFEFAIFYNGLLEFSDSAPIVLNGRVHANSNIYVGALSGSSTTFNALVTTTGTISAPSNDGYSSTAWVAPITYNGKPAPGYVTNAPPFFLPLMSNNVQVSAHARIDLPPPGENTNTLLSKSRFYNQANVVITVNPTNALIVLILRGIGSNLLMTFQNTNGFNSAVPFLNTSITNFDQREKKTVISSQIDVAKLTNWIATNSMIQSQFKFLSPNLFYIADLRVNSSNLMHAVRLTNGSNLPSTGLSIATPNPLYILGNYNCPTNYLNTTNTTLSAPAMVACDALTLLSPAWSDNASLAGKITGNIPVALPDTVNTAIIAGNVPSTGAGNGQYSGGVHNLPRLLENWAGLNLILNTSIACLFSSTVATNQFVQPGNGGQYYSAPNRQFNFDQNYLNPAKLPPATPLISLGARRIYQRFSTNFFQ